jgi:chromosome segregation ATPase
LETVDNQRTRITEQQTEICELVGIIHAQTDELRSRRGTINSLENLNREQYQAAQRELGAQDAQIEDKDARIKDLEELGVDYCKTIREQSDKIESDRIAMAALLEEARDQAREAAMAESRRKASADNWKSEVDELTEQLKKRKTQLYQVIYGNPQATIDLVDEVRKGFTDVI